LVGLRTGDAAILGTWSEAVKDQRNLLDISAPGIPYLVATFRNHRM
jgi:hypothetical protein